MNLCFLGNSMNNLLSYCGLTDARMRASEKDLPVILPFQQLNSFSPNAYTEPKWLEKVNLLQLFLQD